MKIKNQIFFSEKYFSENFFKIFFQNFFSKNIFENKISKYFFKNIFFVANFFFSLILFILVFESCKKKTENAIVSPKEDNEVVAVQTAKIIRKNITHDVIATGVLGSKAESRLSFKTGGIISKIYVKEGDNVQAGQVLATLDMTEINSQVAQAQFGVEKSERDLQRAKNLYRDTVATLEQVQNATTGSELAKKNYEIAQFNQKFSEIRAPRSGKILKKIMNEGELAGPGTPIFFLNEAGNDDWVVRVGVSDKDWALLRTGNSAKIIFDAYPNETFSGTISKLADAADPMSGTYEAEVKVNPNGKRMAYGLFAHVQLQTSKASLLSIVPIEAIIEGSGSSGFVFVPDANGISVKKIPVKISDILGKEIGIASGLENFDTVITAGAAYLNEKSKIKIIN